MFVTKKIESNDDHIKAYAFLDIDFPPVAWAVTRGVLMSALNMSKQYRPGLTSFMVAGIVHSRNNNRFFNELVIENYRAQYYPNTASRLIGMYFFKSKEDALNRVGDPDWPFYFTKNNLVELNLFSPKEPTIVDANWITYAPRDDKGIIDIKNTDWINKYWSGIKYNETPVWEVIADGIAVIPDFEFRKRSEKIILDEFPESLIPLTMARFASEVGSYGGAVSPFLSLVSNKKIKLSYIFDDNDFHNPEIIEKIRTHPHSSYLGKLMHDNEEFKMPDFTTWFTELELCLTENFEGTNIPYVSMHRIE